MTVSFDYQFTVDAPQNVVTAFHHDTSVLKLLTPPPIFAQIHYFEPLGEGSLAEFTLWFGPFPVRWEVIHVDVSEQGFTDIQIKGPLLMWRHTHRFRGLDHQTTLVHEHIEYAHDRGLRGLISRLLFSAPGLYALFTARKFITRRRIRGMIGQAGLNQG